MEIKKEDFKKLCKIARTINEEEKEINRIEIWNDLQKIIDNIK